MQKSDKNTRVLIVEDRHNMMRTLVSMLNQLGLHQTFKAYDGAEAWSLLNDGEIVDLVISDWNMPLLTGIELVRKIRDDDRFRDLPFLMITGEVDRSTVAEAAEEEVDSYLIKPFSLEDLREKVVELLKRKQRPGPLEKLLKSARANLRTGRYFEAEDDLQRARDINPQSPRVAYYTGKLHERRDDLEEARRSFEMAVAVSPHYIKAREALSRVLRAQGDLKGATEHLRVAVDLSPNNVDRQLTFSRCLGKIGQRSELKKVLKNIMKLAGRQHADIARQVGETYLEAGLADEARKAFVKALAEDPNDIYTYNRLGIALRRQKKFSEAIRYYLKAIKIDPENDNLYYNIARAYHESGDKKNSLEAINKALDINPDFWEAKALLAKVSDS